MSRFKWTFTSLSLLIIVGCASPQTKDLSTQRKVTSIRVDSLKVEDLSENMSRLSTQEDEIYLFCFLSNDSTIHKIKSSSLLPFTKSIRTHSLDLQFSDLQATDRLSFFLIELDEDALSDSLIDHCSKAVQQQGFPRNFDHPKLDSLIGDDDLLGMRSLPANECWGPIKLTFQGRQLFDPFKYILFLNGQ